MAKRFSLVLPICRFEVFPRPSADVKDVAPVVGHDGRGEYFSITSFSVSVLEMWRPVSILRTRRLWGFGKRDGELHRSRLGGGNRSPVDSQFTAHREKRPVKVPMVSAFRERCVIAVVKEGQKLFLRFRVDR